MYVHVRCVVYFIYCCNFSSIGIELVLDPEDEENEHSIYPLQSTYVHVNNCSICVCKCVYYKHIVCVYKTCMCKVEVELFQIIFGGGFY